MVGGAEGERERALHEKLNVNHPVHAHKARFNTVLTKEIMCGISAGQLF